MAENRVESSLDRGSIPLENSLTFLPEVEEARSPTSKSLLKLSSSEKSLRLLHPPLSPLQTKKSTPYPSGLSAVKDTLAPAPTSLPFSLAPALSSPSISSDLFLREKEPKRCVAYAIIYLQQSAEDAAKQEMDLTSREVKEKLDDLHKLTAEKTALLKDLAAKTHNLKNWETVKNIAIYFTFATSTVIGLSNPTIVGVVMATSGTVGIVNRLLADSGLWKKIASYFSKKEESQEMASRLIDSSINLTAAGVGLFTYGAGTLYYGSQFFTATPPLELAEKALSYGSTFLYAGAECKKSTIQSDVHKNDARLVIEENSRQLLNNDIKDTIDNMERTVEINSSYTSKISSILTALNECIKKITNKGR